VERARAVLGFAAFGPAALPFERAFVARVLGAAFDVDAARERVAVLLRVPPLDRFVLAIASSKRVLPGDPVLPVRRWF
jgi:hypothetical protein